MICFFISWTIKYFSSFFFLSLMFWSTCQYKKYRFLSINISTIQNPFLSFVDLIWQFEWLHAQPYVLDYVQFLCLEVGVANKRGLQNEKWICKWKFLWGILCRYAVWVMRCLVRYNHLKLDPFFYNYLVGKKNCNLKYFHIILSDFC